MEFLFKLEWSAFFEFADLIWEIANRSLCVHIINLQLPDLIDSAASFQEESE